ncbi:MAG: hypothetical protein WDN23_05070 [Edaphobacter sp.]
MGTDIATVLVEDSYRERLLAAFAEEPELAEVVTVILDLDLSKPREIAAELGISVTEFQNRKKRLRRRLIEYSAVEVSES